MRRDGSMVIAFCNGGGGSSTNAFKNLDVQNRSKTNKRVPMAALNDGAHARGEVTHLHRVRVASALQLPPHQDRQGWNDLGGQIGLLRSTLQQERPFPEYSSAMRTSWFSGVEGGVIGRLVPSTK
jgi:hypothetical protein